MYQHLSLGVDPEPKRPLKTIADLCRTVRGASLLPAGAEITFTLGRDNQLRAVGVELAL